jgi:DNA transposition AAA+ family ATPase
MIRTEIKEHSFPLRDRLCGFLRNKSLTYDRFALMAGVALYDLKRWRAGHYLGDIADIENKIRAVLDREESLNKRQPDADFIETSVTRRAQDCLRLCHIQNLMGVLYGDAGIGKTVSCHAYIARYPDTLFIESLPGYSATAVIKRLCSLLSLQEGLNLADSMEIVTRYLKGSKRLIIVDEGENVSYRGLELIRRLHDFSECPVLLVGLPQLLSNLRGSNGQYRQLFSRISVAVKLQNIDEDDAEALVRHWLPEAGNLWPDFWKVGGANARRLSNLCQMSRHVARVNERPIDRKVILSAVEVLIS